MVMTCCVCGVKWSPSDCNRTFHKFPQDEVMKQKWCEVLGFQRIYKTAVVCSEHFKKEDYRSLCEKPLLNKNAVPIPIKTRTSNLQKKDKNFEITNVIQNVEKHSDFKNNMDMDNMDMDGTEDTENKATDKRDNKCCSLIACDDAESVEMDDSPTNNIYCSMEDVNSSEDNSENYSKKRKFSGFEINTEKRVRFMLPQYGVMRKDDFKSDEAWNRFLQFFQHSQDSLKKIARQKKRLEVKLNNLSDLINSLKKENLLTEKAAEIMEVRSNK